MGQEVGREPMQVEGEVEIDDAIGEEVVIENAGVAELHGLDRDQLVAGRHVGELQRRNGGERLGRIRRFLHALEHAGFLGDRCEIGCGHRRPHTREPLRLLFRFPLALLAIRPQQQGDAVAIADEMAPEQVLEIAPGGDARLDGGERCLEGERRQRIAIAHPGGQCPEHERDAARERVGVALAQAELDGVERGRDGRRIDAVSGELADRVVDQALDLVGIGGIDALEADRERRLAQNLCQAGLGQTFSQPGIDQGLVERRGRGAEQDLPQDLEAECRFGVRDLLDHPADVDHQLTGRRPERMRLALVGPGLLRPRRIGVRQPPGRAKTRLQRHGEVDVDTGELGQPVVDQPQPLLGVVVAVEEQLGVRRVVVVRVERLELLVGEIGDVLGVAARVEAVGRLGEQRANCEAHQQAVGRRVGALHLVEDHAFVSERRVGCIELVMPALLLEGLPR